MIALQTQLPMRAQSLCRLLDVHCVRVMAGIGEDDALALARMDWGFDISTGEARSIELRLLPASVENYIATGGTKRLDWTWEDVSESLVKGVPARQHSINGISRCEFIDGKTAQHILNCSSTHFMNLLNGSRLRKVPGTAHGTGPNGTPKITVESFLEFLRQRRVR